MARFSGKIQSAKFVNQDENVIEILYGDTPTQLSSWILQIDYSNQDFLDFLEEYELEDVADSTYKYHSDNKSAYEREVEAKASQMACEMAQDMFNKWLEPAAKDIKEEYDKVDSYREEQLRIMEAEVELYKQEQIAVVQAEMDQQVQERYIEVDNYKQSQIEAIQAEIDQQVQERYIEVDNYKQSQIAAVQAEMDQQVQERYVEVDRYKESQLADLQQTQQALIREREEAEQVKAESIYYVETQKKQMEKLREDIDQEKTSLLEKFKAGLGLPQQSSTAMGGEEFIKLLFSKNEDENFLFKAKIAVFNQDHVKNNPDREAKMAIKKSKSIVELVVAMNL